MFRSVLSMLLVTAMASLAMAAPINAQLHGDAWQYGTGGGIVGFIVLILDVIIIMEVLKSNRPVPHKVLWSLLVFLFPILGAIVYYLFSDRVAHKQGAGYEPIP